MSTVHKHEHEHEHESHGQEVCCRADSSSGDSLDSNSKTRYLQSQQQISRDHLCICVLQDATGTEGVLQTSL